MRARLARYLSGINPDLTGEYSGDIEQVYGAAGGGMIVRLRIDDPPSSRGRGLYLYLDTRDVTDLLLLLRSQAIQDRNQSMAAKR